MHFICLQIQAVVVYYCTEKGGETVPPKSQQQREAADKYLREKVDTIVTRVPKGKKEIVQTHAAARGESVNGFMNRAISETMERDNEGGEQE